ncbi:MAG TPA: tRNA lysidine(34) synthetase TilS, partial [Burkholderiaceae bacterium]|nr:tRNA lysidine(34) synthetase TilS [Burkholderiaceae bacterium]
MAGLRKSPQKFDASEAPEALLAQALKQALGHVAQGAGASPTVVLAYSGGRDSTVLLDLACRLRDEGFAPARSLLAVHVHHGLQPAADAWAMHCHEQCQHRGIAFELMKVAVKRGKAGIEAAAREARYGALLQAAASHRAQAVCVAHHLDDRIETFLLQWLRGAGVAGLSSFPFERQLSPGVRLLRPFAQTPRRWLEAYCVRYELPFVDDPSNEDEAHARSALRQHVMPALERIRPDFRRTTARSIDLLAQMGELLEEVAGDDFAQCVQGTQGDRLSLAALRTLSASRQQEVLRFWLRLQGLQAPSRAQLCEMLRQALDARSDARVRMRLGPSELYRYRGQLLLRQASLAVSRQAVALSWQGQPCLEVPAWGGRLFFEPASEGFDAQWLQAGPLIMGSRTGGERLKLHLRRPSKALKACFQEAGVAEPERGLLPLL